METVSDFDGTAQHEHERDGYTKKKTAKNKKKNEKKNT